MPLRVLPKLLHLKAKQERWARLSVPSSAKAKHGQGQYVRQFVQGAVQSMQLLARKLKNTAEHYHIMRYAFDKYDTQDRQARWNEEPGAECPACAVHGRAGMRQTKEHLWSG